MGSTLIFLSMLVLFTRQGPYGPCQKAIQVCLSMSLPVFRVEQIELSKSSCGSLFRSVQNNRLRLSLDMEATATKQAGLLVLFHPKFHHR